jgi:hypothetical protein
VPVIDAPPTTKILVAVILEVPLIVRADLELESTTTSPLTLMNELPLTVNAPLTLGFKTRMELTTTAVPVTEPETLPSWLRLTEIVKVPLIAYK